MSTEFENAFTQPIPSRRQPHPLITILLSLCTALLVGTFVFAWDTNAKLTLLSDHDQTSKETQGRQQIEMNNMNLQLFDVKERVNTLETKQSYENPRQSYQPSKK